MLRKSFLWSSCSEDLFSHAAILSMCTLESTFLRSAPQFRDLCETKGPVDCCPGWNLGGYVALINNRSSCFGITVSNECINAEWATADRTSCGSWFKS